MVGNKGKLFIVSGTSAAGKTTIVTEALKRVEGEYNISRIVTYTSRPRREDEIDGKDYVFVSREEFDKKEKEGFFLESTAYVGHKSGSPLPSREEVELGKSFVLIVDLAGAKEVKKFFKNGVSIWIEPPSIEVLRARLKKRGTRSDADFERRVNLADEEIKEAHKIRLFDYFLVNEDFERSVEEFVLILKKTLVD